MSQREPPGESHETTPNETPSPMAEGLCSIVSGVQQVRRATRKRLSAEAIKVLGTATHVVRALGRL